MQGFLAFEIVVASLPQSKNQTLSFFFSSHRFCEDCSRYDFTLFYYAASANSGTYELISIAQVSDFSFSVLNPTC